MMNLLMRRGRIKIIGSKKRKRKKRPWKNSQRSQRRIRS